ncbi:amidohydrolase family protein [Nocardia sp. NPDC049190]|uniref:amidohydrolase family protein n=1 Tax=Nocardia sp. NPDC049190 TaxID=3155650 RepID=UPI0033C4067A
MTAFVPSSQVERIRQAINHPIVDADGHILEYLPLIHEIAEELSDRPTADDMLADLCDRTTRLRSTDRRDRRSMGMWRGSWWGAPAANTTDRATTTLPRLLYHRLDELGIDFQFVYPTLGLLVFLTPDADLRRLMARSFNIYYSSVFEGVRDRLEPGAVIPMHTPQEAVEEIRFAVSELSLRTVVMTGVIRRPLPGGGVPGAIWMDTVGHSGDHDYDPVWEECRRLRVVPTFHGTGMGWGSRVSPDNYIFNHLGSFSAACEATCRSLVMGGAVARFPELSWMFLEGGVTWAAQLQADLLEHFEKRNRQAVSQYDPRLIDWEQMNALFAEYATGRLAKSERPSSQAWVPYLSDPGDGDPLQDDFADSGVTAPEQFLEFFSSFYFGCEPDDRLCAVAFDRRLNPHDANLNAVFSTDIGHWDVRDSREVLGEVWRLREQSLLSERDFRALTYSNVVESHTRMNPDFFRGTALDGTGLD